MLPQCVVGVLDRQRRPLRLLAAAARRVGGGQALRERAQRPAVTRDVVEHHLEDVLVRRQLEQFDPQRHIDRQVEQAVLGRRHQSGQIGLGGPAHEQPRAGCLHLQHLLVRHAVHCREDGAQALVPGHHVRHGGLQGPPVQLPGQPPCQGDVVVGTDALQLVEEPQPSLRERQRDHVGALAPDKGGLRRPGRRQSGGQARRGRRLEQGAQRHLHAECRADPGDEAGGQQRVPAQLEEPVLDAGRRHPQNLREQLAEDLLLRSARRPGGGRRGEVGSGQGPMVQLAVGGQRQRVQDEERRRHHVLRQPLAQVLPQVGGARCGAHGRHQVRGQPGVVGPVLPRQYGDLGDLRIRGQRCLDLAELDPEAAHLHLLVGPADVAQAAVRRAAHQVTAAVHPRPRRPERVCHEPPGSQARPVQVAARQARARDVQLAGYARGHRPQAVVEHVRPQVREGRADLAGGGAGPVERRVRDVHRGLGDAVHVDQPRRVLRVPVVPARQPGVLQRLTAEHHRAQGESAAGLPGLRVRLHQLVEGGRRLVEHRHPLAGEQFQEPAGRAAGVVVHDHQAAAVQQRAPQLPHREVEGVGVEEGPHVLGGEAEQVPRGVEQAHHVAVRDHHAFGVAGGTGGVNDVGGLARVDGDPRVRVRQPVQDGGVQQQPVHVLRPRQLSDPARRHEQRGLGVLEQIGDSGSRVLRVHRYVRGAGLEDREHRDDQLRRTRQGQRHQVLRPHSAVDQDMRQPVGAGVHLAVRQSGFAVREGGRVRVRPHLPLEQCGQAVLRQFPVPVGAGRQQCPELVGGQHVHLADPSAGVGDDGAQQPQPPFDDFGDGGRVEQVGAVLHHARQPVLARLFGQDEVQVTLGRPGVDQVGRYPQPRQVEGAGRCVLQGEHGLEQGVVRKRPGRVQRLHEVLERHLLVRVRGQRVGTNPAQQVGERRVAGQIGAQHQGVDEEADQVVEGLVGATRDRRADRDVGTGAELAHQSGQTGLEHHEEAGSAVAADFAQLPVQIGVDPDRQVSAPVGHRRRPGSVEGQLDLLGEVRQRVPPVCELAAEQAVGGSAVSQQLLLPEGVVGVLDRQR
ncbi:hypothetical protein EES39_32270 [Streptomyces sp. ADI92-24]|nr:hypothetical protein EES39_32270 [Streptomyces sp. ADI92-24]